MSNQICVIGAGISGLTVADQLSGHGAEVHLIEQNSHPGGRSVFYGCKATDTCAHCGVCLVRDAVADFRRNDRLHTHLSSQTNSVRANGKGLEIEIESTPNPISWRDCIECGLCQQQCPEKAIERIPGWKFVVNDNCSQCGQCISVCPVKAIKLDRPAVQETLQADQLVVSSGFQPFDPRINRKWGSGSPRVLTGTELEHLFFEETYLPRTDDEPKKLAFIQCVGSRNVMEGEQQCSRVCCAYALRMAVRLHEEFPKLGIDMYYMDIQHFGSDFEQFWDTTRKKINLIQSHPISVRIDSQGHPIVRYEAPDSLHCREQSYDWIVLSHGLTPADSSQSLADLFGLTLDPGGFFQKNANPILHTAGTCKHPMRIDECVEDARTVAQQVIQSMEVIA